MVCPHTAKPLFPPTPTLHGPNYTHKHLPTHICLFRQTIQKSMLQISYTHFFFQCSTFVLLRTHTFTHSRSLTHAHTHISVAFQHHWQGDKQQIWEVTTAFFLRKKKRGKHQNQPRPEIDEWWQRRWFWQAEWSRSLNGFIQEEIRNTHTHTHRVWSVHYLSRDDPKINNNNGEISQ